MKTSALTTRRWTLALALGALALTALAVPAAAQPAATYRVTVTNISQQIISPPIVASHSWRTRIFVPGYAASPELAAVAEDADASGLLAALGADPQVLDFAIGDGPLMPGASATLEIEVDPRHNRLSAVGMLVTTNDAFFGLNNLILDGGPGVMHVSVPAYDAGSEANNELCAFIPGPPCGNGGVRDTDGAEGFISVHPGIHGIGDLSAAAWDWRNPVARLTIVRQRGQ